MRKEVAPGWDEGKLTSGGESVRFSLTSDDGDEGFPGTVEVSVVYTAGKKTEGDGREVTVLGMEYEATLVGGAEETVVNMTNHSFVPPPPMWSINAIYHAIIIPELTTYPPQPSYFNLSGSPTIEGTKLSLITNAHLPLDPTGIPSTTASAPFSAFVGGHDNPFVLGAEAPDVDDCFVLNPSSPSSVPIDTRASPLNKLVAAEHPGSGVHLEVWSTEPAFQFYTGKHVDVPETAGAPARGARAGFCVEPSRWVNAVNVPEWRNQVVLKKGETYGARIVYRAWKE